MRSTR